MARRPTRSTPSTHSSCTDGGFSLVELLATIGIASLAFAGASTVLASSRYFMQTQMQRIETVQALRATIDSMTRDIRLGAACLPITGDFSPLDGVNNGTADSITSRTGLVRPNLTCIYPALAVNAPAGATALTVSDSSGFAVGMGGYIYNGSSGDTFIVTSVTGNTIGSNRAISQAYSVGSATVYAIDQRTYTIDTTVSPPNLTLAINGAAAQPFATGIEALNIQYRLNRNCPPCDTLDLPTSTSDWQLVNEIIINVTARSQKKDLAGNYFRRSVQFIAKPRNLLPAS